jgi:ABC-type branched-subunit amino acid transport system substrate-binding protein
MKNIYRLLLLFITLFSIVKTGAGQPAATKPVKVAVFIPLYADEAFSSTFSSGSKLTLPKSVLPGLEFYNGVMMAIDSLNQEGTFAEINIYDTKHVTRTPADIFKSAEFNNVGLIIAAITNPAELKVFSDQALAKNIPIISATYPNYVGVSSNPFFVLLNSSFQAHLDGLYKFMKKQYSSKDIIAVTRKGGKNEGFMKTYIDNLNKKGTSIPLKIKWVSLDETSMKIDDFSTLLDSTKQNVVFVASPSEDFGVNVVRMLSNNDKYPVTAIGSPTWDNVKELDKPSCKNVEIVFSTPFLFYANNKTLSSSINARYKDRYYSRPSDMVFKGFEITYHFTKLLEKHRHNLVNNLSDKEFTLLINLYWSPG